MLGMITNLFAMSKPDKIEHELKFREVVFTGSKLQIGLPENYSRDFPADDVVTELYLTDSAFTDADQQLILRRWWDFSEKTFLSSREAGALMLAVSVVHTDKAYTDRAGLIQNIHKKLERQHSASNQTSDPDFVVAYPQTYESFTEELFNNQRWLSYPMALMNSSEATKTYIAPLNQHYYLQLAFTMMPSSRIDIRQFEDMYARKFIKRIMNKLVLKYEYEISLSMPDFSVSAIEFTRLLEQQDNH